MVPFDFHRRYALPIRCARLWTCLAVSSESSSTLCQLLAFANAAILSSSLVGQRRLTPNSKLNPPLTLTNVSLWIAVRMPCGSCANPRKASSWLTVPHISISSPASPKVLIFQEHSQRLVIVLNDQRRKGRTLTGASSQDACKKTEKQTECQAIGCEWETAPVPASRFTCQRASPTVLRGLTSSPAVVTALHVLRSSKSAVRRASGRLESVRSQQ